MASPMCENDTARPPAKTRTKPATAIDPELGPVRRCTRCHEWWPDDTEFFRRRNLRTGRNTCKACEQDMHGRRPIPLRPTTHGSTFDIKAKRARDRERKRALRADPILGDKLRERQARTQRAYYQRHRARILPAIRERARERYAAKIGRPLLHHHGRPRLDDAA